MPPKFDLGNQSSAAIEKRVKDQLERVTARSKEAAVPQIFEPRCDVCNSPFRDQIDRLLAMGGVSYTTIAEKLPGKDGKKIGRRSISNHDKEHLSFRDDAIRRLLVAEAEEAGQNYETDVKGAITRRGSLEIMHRKVLEGMLSGIIEFEAKDMIAVVGALEKMDEATNSAQVEFLKAQTAAFLQAIKDEIDDREMWNNINIRARRYMSIEGFEMNPEPEIIEAEVVNELPPAD